MIGKSEAEEQAAQLDQRGAPALGLEIPHVVQHPRGALQDALERLEVRRVREVDLGGRPPGCSTRLIFQIGVERARASKLVSSIRPRPAPGSWTDNPRRWECGPGRGSNSSARSKARSSPIQRAARPAWARSRRGFGGSQASSRIRRAGPSRGQDCAANQPSCPQPARHRQSPH